MDWNLNTALDQALAHDPATMFDTQREWHTHNREWLRQLEREPRRSARRVRSDRAFRIVRDYE